MNSQHNHGEITLFAGFAIAIIILGVLVLAINP
jgi:hypothetical protein